MKKSFSLRGFFKFSLIGSIVVFLTAVVLLLTIGGNTEPSFTLGNIGISFLLKAFIYVVLVFFLTMVYYLICYKKKGLKMALFSLVGGLMSALVSFLFCVICRSSLGDLCFPIILTAVLLSYISSAIFFRGYSERGGKKKKGEVLETPFERASSKSFGIMLYVVLLITLIMVAAFIVSMIFSCEVLALCVLPMILSAVYSVVVTLAFACRLYSNKE